MALILLVQVQPQVFTAKCSEPQVGNPGYDGYYVNKGSDNKRKWEYLEFMYLQSIEDFPEFLHELYKKVQEMSHVFEAPVGKSNIEKYF